MMDASILLDRCPFCDYSLEGLPTEHRCPECGQPFDRRWRVFGTKTGWQSMAKGWRIATIAVCGYLVLSSIVRRAPRGMGMSLWFDGLGLLFMIGVLTRSLVRRPRRFVAVGPEDIALGDRSTLELRRFGWGRVQEVRTTTWGRLHIRADGEWIVWSLGYGFDAEAHRCEDYIDKHVDLPE